MTIQQLSPRLVWGIITTHELRDSSFRLRITKNRKLRLIQVAGPHEAAALFPYVQNDFPDCDITLEVNRGCGWQDWQDKQGRDFIGAFMV